MNHTANEKLKDLIDIYGADLATWPEDIDASIKQRIQNDRSLQRYLQQTTELDDSLQILLQMERPRQSDITNLAQRIQASRPVAAARTTGHWWSWFSSMPFRAAFATVLVAAIVMSTMHMNQPRDNTDLVFAQWAWEEVLDETPDSQPGVLNDEFGFLMSEG